jgi:hypothetical protein
LRQTLEPVSDDHPRDPLEQGPALRADGSLDLGEPARDPVTGEPLRRFAELEAPLELVERTRPPPTAWEPAPSYRPTPQQRPSRFVWWLIGFAVLAAIGVVVAAALVVPRWAPEKDGVTSAPTILDGLPALATATVIIESTPAGATIVAGEDTLGVTPWAGNLPLSPTTRLTLTLKGYRPWTGTLKDAPENHLNVTLKRAR